MTLSDTHLMVLSAAAAREDKLVTKHKRLPGASLQKVCAALVKRGLLAELTGVSPDPDVLKAKTDLGMTEYAITPSGLAAIGVDDECRSASTSSPPYGEDVPKDVRAGVDPFLIEGPDNNPPDEADAAPTGAEDAAGATSPAAEETARPTTTTAPMRGTLRAAAQAVLRAWDDEENQRYGLTEAIDGLRAALAGAARTRREPGTPRTPRAGTKQETVLALLRRSEGATIAQIIDTTGWQSHTVRGFLAGLKRKGITVEVLERVRQVGPNKEGAKGSYSVYRVATAGEAQ
ncbi:DUF3489 domain-containing protein [Elioraea sp.]|uniref:DUF3489 domain-containing protein n=1 Tax=Elioraea sp. TaxID=2185103 RepID=UPI0021DBCC0C|nr:DUF3489 domain-containing protein [Elioraea sp.]GIX11585.1 MAG: hypothetical protein KatS3mg116_3295 [Elioraea sp.]